MSDSAVAPEAGSSGEDATPSSVKAPGVDSEASTSDLLKGLETIRGGLQKYGAALGAGATALLGGIGWATIHNLYPVPQDQKWLGPLVILLAILGSLASFGAAASFFSAQRRIVFDTADPREAPGLTSGEKAVVVRVLTDFAKANGAFRLKDLELRAQRLERIARTRKDDAQAAALSKEAARISSEVNYAAVTAATSVLESRNERQFRVLRFPPSPFVALAGLALVSVLFVFYLSDFSKGQRELIDLQIKCGKEKVNTSACADVAAQSPATPVTPPAPPTPTANVAPIKLFMRCYDEAQTRKVPARYVSDVVRACSGVAFQGPGAEPSASATSAPSAP